MLDSFFNNISTEMFAFIWIVLMIFSMLILTTGRTRSYGDF